MTTPTTINISTAASLQRDLNAQIEAMLSATQMTLMSWDKKQQIIAALQAAKKAVGA